MGATELQTFLISSLVGLAAGYTLHCSGESVYEFYKQHKSKIVSNMAKNASDNVGSLVEEMVDDVDDLAVESQYKNADTLTKPSGVLDDAADDLAVKTQNVNLDKGGSPSGKVWDYSKQFNGELSNFNDGYNIYSVVDKDMYLVQFHSGAEVGSGRSLKYWTTIEEANGISTIDDYMDNMALMSDWGVRDNVSIARIPAGTKIKYAVGTARRQMGPFETRPGGGLQILFEQFNDSWVIDTRKMP